MTKIKLEAILATAALLLIPYFYLRSYQTKKANALEAKQHSFQPITTLPNRWPLGLDLLYGAYKYSTEGHVLSFFVALMKSIPPTFEQRLLGISGINTIDPKNIEAILGTEFTSFGMGDRPQVWFPLIGPGIFTQDGEEWKHSRNLLRPFFQSKRNDNFLEVQESVSVLLESIPSGRVVDFQPLFFRFTLDTTTYLLFGRPIRSLGDSNEEAEAFGESFRVSQYYLSQRGHLGPLHWLCNPKSFKDANRTVHRWIDREIKTVLETYKNDPSKDKDTKNSYGYLGALMAETQEPKELRDALLNILLAGRDTTACMLTWMMRLLVKHQDVLKKLREEIENIVGVGEEGRDPDRNDLKKMLYLSYVCKEVLRLYPSVPLNSRAAVKTTILPTGGGPDGTAPVYVKKGTAVGWAVYAMHRRTDLYGSDAEAFRPERWDPNIDNEINLKNIGWGYLPFNGGPRVCIGQEFALLEASYAMIRLIQKFKKFEYDPARGPIPEIGEEKQDLTLVLSSGEGCCVQATSY